MSASSTLVVPIDVAALAVNTRVRDGGSIRRAAANFQRVVRDHAPAEPAPFDNDKDWRDDPDVLGVYLQWQLPEALARGRHDPDGGVGDFPLVPNRWLVVRYRYESREVRSWLVESDYLDEWQGTVSYLDPHAGTPTATKIGRRHDIAPGSPWREPSGRREPFLTAIGPGLLNFSVYQPFNENVFSMHDPLDGIDGDDRLAYFVAGWYADPDSDILMSEEDSAALIESLDWSPTPGSGPRRRSVYTGSVLGLNWTPDTEIPDSIPDRRDIAVAVGNSTAEAASALLDEADGTGALSADDAELFRAFVLDALDQLDKPEGQDLVQRAAHRSGFARGPGGYTWQVADRGDPLALPPEPADQRVRRLRAEHDTIGELNRLQAEHDRIERELAAAQERLYHLWYLNALPERDKPREFTSAIGAQLDPDDPDGAAGRVKALTEQLAEARSALPWGRDPEDLAEAAKAHADAHGLPEHRVLVRVPAEEFDHSADPVVLLQGANLHAPLSRDGALPCRTPDRVVTRVTDAGTTVDAAGVQPDVAKVPLDDLPEALRALATEFFILERARARGLSLDDHDGALPELGTGEWKQAWQPMALHWSGDYFPVPFQDTDTGTDYWWFDGVRYRWTGQGDRPDPFTVQGNQLLMPSAGAALEGQLAAYSAHRGDLPADLIRSLRREAAEQDLLSQRLDGFGAGLGQRKPGGGLLVPTGPLAELTGHGDRQAPEPGDLPESDWDPNPESRFQQLRSGQMLFTGLSIVDRFGRSVDLILDPAHFTPTALPDSMVPDHPIGETGADRYVELGPRLLQPGRLHFGFLSATGDEEIDFRPEENPVCGWLLHNRLDAALACYAPEGRALGELRTVLAPSGSREVAWRRLPGSSLVSLDDLAADFPHLHRFLAAIQRKGPDTLTAVLATVDEALTTIDPEAPQDGGMGFFLGRPLAMVRAKLDLQLDGPPRTDVNWFDVIDPPTPKALEYRWTIRLGEPAHSDDGLVGFVLNGDYDHLETVVAPEGPDTGYLRPIGAGERLRLSFDSADTAEVTLLVDPRAAVHATTDLLPVGSLHIPARFVEPALAAMAVCFRSGPLLAATRETEVDGRTVEVAILPEPATPVGTWSWSEQVGEEWRDRPISPLAPDELPRTMPEIRSGYLVLGDATSAGRAAT
ncbi:hypothetical protein [Marinactinospora rubrisoli]|uniref:Uncharacterized protein n=1 Tax=Marinactinospora rubrisoli TaxID=2715399 RepID=A0ABW2KL56_9ACTN